MREPSAETRAAKSALLHSEWEGHTHSSTNWIWQIACVFAVTVCNPVTSPIQRSKRRPAVLHGSRGRTAELPSRRPSQESHGHEFTTHQSTVPCNLCMRDLPVSCLGSGPGEMVSTRHLAVVRDNSMLLILLYRAAKKIFFFFFFFFYSATATIRQSAKSRAHRAGKAWSM